MAKKPGNNKAAAPAKNAGPTRKARNSNERKCLPRSLKIQFANSDKSVFKMVLGAWVESRKKNRNAPIM